MENRSFASVVRDWEIGKRFRAQIRRSGKKFLLVVSRRISLWRPGIRKTTALLKSDTCVRFPNSDRSTRTRRTFGNVLRSFFCRKKKPYVISVKCPCDTFFATVRIDRNRTRSVLKNADFFYLHNNECFDSWLISKKKKKNVAVSSSGKPHFRISFAVDVLNEQNRFKNSERRNLLFRSYNTNVVPNFSFNFFFFRREMSRSTYQNRNQWFYGFELIFKIKILEHSSSQMVQYTIPAAEIN